MASSLDLAVAEIRAVEQASARAEILQELPAEFRGVFSQHGITLPDENWQLQEFVNAFNRTLAAHDKDVELAVYRRF
jgi:predicted nuclease of restriction endonuclease-like (RecB) superfamily